MDTHTIEWTLGEGHGSITFSFKQKKNILNRFRWWLGTNTIIPGTYKWIESK